MGMIRTYRTADTNNIMYGIVSAVAEFPTIRLPGIAGNDLVTLSDGETAMQVLGWGAMQEGGK